MPALPFYEKTTLGSGIRVVSERIPHVRSASVGVWVGAGSLWEDASNLGISHLIEHLLFKGTTTRSAREIAQAIDGRGGSLNAFTSKEHTCYYAKVLDKHFPIAVEVLADMLQRSLLEPADIAREQGVIVEEIKMYEDMPDDQVHDLFGATIWSGHALGRTVVGTAQSVSALEREALLAYMARHYTAHNMVVAVAGNVEHAEAVAEVERRFAGVQAQGTGMASPAPPTGPSIARAALRPKDIEQVHLVVGYSGLPQDHDEIWALHLINAVLGGGPGSRLFQSIREERGLAYSVYSYQSGYKTAGTFGVYAGMSPAAAPEVLDLIQTELAATGQRGLTDAELQEAKDQLKGQIMLSLESTSGRMTRLGRGELSLGRVLSPDQVAERIDAVTPEGVRALCRRLFSQPQTLAAIGPLGDLDWSRYGFAEVEHG